VTTAQEQFWAGPDGNSYTERNGNSLVSSKIGLFEQALHGRSRSIKSVIEFGANRGLNIQALQHILGSDTRYTAVEINSAACNRIHEDLNGGVLKNGIYEASSPPLVHICNASLLELEAWPRAREAHDLSLVQGVLIHIAPDDLPLAYANIYGASRRYVLVAEYFSREPVAIPYRGRDGLLWKRDFAAEMLETFPDLRLIDYGFVSRLDPIAPLDDIHWWLTEKSA
jgi:pseudaminic acid biosynthesis-associated methylase